MSTFLAGFMKQMEEATGQAPPWGDVNPLVVIGLTEAILDLGLNEDQLYAVINSYRRQLGAQVHPDRPQVNVSPERQRQILGAFDILDDRSHFSQALKHFKTLRAEDRREIRIMSEALRSLRSQILGFESQFDDLKNARKKFGADCRRFEAHKKEEPLVVPGMKKEIESLSQRVESLTDLLKHSRESTSKWKRQFESVADYIGSLGETTDKYPSSIHVFDARWVAVVSLWPCDTFNNPSPLEEDGSVGSDFFREALAVVKKKNIVIKIVNAWRDIVSQINTIDKLDSERLPVGLSIIKLNAGRGTIISGHKSVGFGGRIIGSLPFDKVPVTRSTLRHQITREIVCETIHPFIIPNSVLVSLRRDPQRIASWSLSSPAFHFTTKRVVIAVG